MTADVPQIVTRAADRALHDHHGIVGYRLQQITELHAARFYKRSDNFVMAAVFDGDQLIGIRVLQFTQNGREATAEEKTAIKSSLERASVAPGFAVPFDARHFAEYNYVQIGASSVRFTSLARDARHGDGVFTENAQGDVIRMSYVPDVLPPHADAGTITIERSEVLPGFWATATETQHYQGHYGPFQGYGEILTKERDFRRFQNRAAALAALAHGDI